MLMVAPSGSVKLEISLETPLFSSTAVIVSGRVAPEEEVENAVSRGVVIFREMPVRSGFTDKPDQQGQGNKRVNGKGQKDRSDILPHAGNQLAQIILVGNHF